MPRSDTVTPDSMTKTGVRAGSVRLVSRAGRGRPPVHQETWSKVSVVLFDRQIVHLDRLATDTRVKGAKAMNRAKIIRALIDGLTDSGMDITGSGSAGALRARVARRLGTSFRRAAPAVGAIWYAAPLLTEIRL